MGEGTVEVGAKDVFNRRKWVFGAGSGRVEDDEVLLEVNRCCAMVEGFVRVSVSHQCCEEWVLIDTFFQRAEITGWICNVEPVVKVVDSADDDAVVEAKILAADGSLLIRACAGQSFCPQKKESIGPLAYRKKFLSAIVVSLQRYVGPKLASRRKERRCFRVEDPHGLH